MRGSHTDGTSSNQSRLTRMCTVDRTQRPCRIRSLESEGVGRDGLWGGGGVVNRPMRGDTDLAAGEDTSSGRPSQFSAVFREQYPRAVRLAYLYCGDSYMAEDAVADAMANVFVRWRAGKVREVGPYLRRAVVNEVRRSGRRKVVARRHRERRRGDLRGGRASTDTVEDRDEMLVALQQLPERQRLAVVLRYYERLSELETAEVMGITVGGVKSQTSRALEHLRALLATEEAGS